VTSATRSGVPRESFARSLASGLVGGYDVEGPRVRLGLLWLVALVGAIVLGGWALGLLMGLVAGAAGSQSASAWVFGGMAAAMCPLGQVLATAMLPTAESRAPSLRRMDSLLLVGPLWAWALWGYLA
jgi:hypothetical protein